MQENPLNQNKINLIRYDKENVPQTKLDKHNEIYTTLSPEEQKKYIKASYSAKKIVKEFCTKYNLAFEEFGFILHEGKYGSGQHIVGEDDKSVAQNTSNISYIKINVGAITDPDIDDIELKILMVHEYLGHAILGNAYQKHSDTLSLTHSGMAIIKNREFEMELDQKHIDKIKTKLENNQELSDYEKTIMHSFMVEGDGYGWYEPLIKRAEEAKSKNTDTKVTMKIYNTFGQTLDEGITDYLAITLCTHSQEEFEKYKNGEGAYTEFINNILAIKTFILRYNEEIDDIQFNKMLVELKLTGNIGILKAYILQKTGISIPFKEFYERKIDLEKYITK